MEKSDANEAPALKGAKIEIKPRPQKGAKILVYNLQS